MVLHNYQEFTDFSVTREDVTKAIKMCKNKGNTMGSTLDHNILDKFHDSITDILVICFNDICSSAIIPATWKQTTITPIPKVPKPKMLNDYI